MLELVDLLTQGLFCFFSILFFFIAYKTDIFTIKSEKNWEILKTQYSMLYNKLDQDKKLFPNEIATLCYNVQEYITDLQWDYIYIIILSDIVFIILALFLIDTNIYLYAMALIIGSSMTFTLCYFINNVYFGTVMKVPLRSDPLRWAYGNGFFLCLFCIGMILLSIIIIDLVSHLTNYSLQIPFQIGCLISIFLKREQQQLIGRAIEISCDLLIRGNRADPEIQQESTYNQKMGSVIGFILADTHLLDLLMVLSLYFNLPKVIQINNVSTNFYSLVLLANFFAQFVLSFFISAVQNQDLAHNVVSNTRIQIISASLFSVGFTTLLIEYDSQLMAIASFGLISSVIMLVFLEYMTNHSYPQVRNLGSCALNAPMLNIMNGNYIGDMGQYFIILIIGLSTFIARELSGIEGLYAFLTGVLMNCLVMMCIQFSGNSIMAGLRIAQIAQIDIQYLEQVNLATSNYCIYIKQTILISFIIIALMLIPFEQLEFPSLALGCVNAFFLKGTDLKMVYSYIVECMQEEDYLLCPQAAQKWKLGLLFFLQLVLMTLIFIAFKENGLYSYICGFSMVVTLFAAKSLIVGSSIRSIRIFEGTKNINQLIYLSHINADIQGIGLEESNGLPKIGYLCSVIVFGIALSSENYVI